MRRWTLAYSGLCLLLTGSTIAWADAQQKKEAAPQKSNLSSSTASEPSSQHQKTSANDRKSAASSPTGPGQTNSRQQILPTFSNVKYGPHDRNVLNFWKAKSDKPTPVYFMIHGGGWMNGGKSESFSVSNPNLWSGVPYLADGISVVSISYRLTPKHPLPAPVHDAARALQFVRSKAAEWGINENRIAVAGGSAGATTSLWLAYHDDLADPSSSDPVAQESTKPQCAVAEAAQTCIDPILAQQWVGDKILAHPMIPASVGEKSAADLMANYEKHKATLREFSPFFYVDKNDPSTLLYCFGTTETPAPSAGVAIHDTILSWKLKLKADQVGAECDMLIRTTQKKEFYVSAVRDFIRSKLLTPPNAPTRDTTKKGTRSAAQAIQALPSTVRPTPSPYRRSRPPKLNQLIREKRGDVDMVFIGDSITHFWENQGKPVWDQYYSKRNAVNLGVSSDKTENVLWRLQNSNLEGISPKLAVLMIGTNNGGKNTSEEIAMGIKAIVKTIHEKCPKTKVLILGIFPRGKDDSDRRRQKNMRVNKIVAKLADERSVFYLNIGQAMLGPDRTLSKDIMPDLLHPNTKGYQIWAEAMEDRVKKLLEEK